MDQTILEDLGNVLHQLDDRITSLEHSVNDIIIGSLKEASDEYEYNDGLEAFKNNYGGIGDLEAQLKALHGDDYDVYKAFYDSARKHSSDPGYDEGNFVQATINELKNRFSAMNEASQPVVIVEETKEEEEGDDSAEFPSEEELAKELAEAL